MTAHDDARPRIDLNADVGEGFDDASLMPLITSANVACGAHAGDDETMRTTVQLALQHGVAVGAHPGFPDRAGFGRTITTRDPNEIAAVVTEQVERLVAVVRDAGASLTHVKPHGALYNLSAVDDAVATAIARAVAASAPGASLVGLAGSRSLAAGRDAGLTVLAEGFADRGYLSDGTLAPRARAGALIEDPAASARRAVQLARGDAIETLDGAPITLAADTLCLHGDTPGAAASARAVRAALEAAGVRVAAPAGPAARQD